MRRSRDAPQPAIELARMIHELLEARPDRLGDPSASFAPAPSTSSGAITSVSSSMSVATAVSADGREASQQPLIHRIAQSRKDGRQQIVSRNVRIIATKPPRSP